MKASNKIDIILSALDIKAPTFAKNIGVLYKRIQDIQGEKTKKISGEVAAKINAIYPQFDLDWLLADDESLPAFITNVNGITNVKGVQIVGAADLSRENELLREQNALLKQSLADKNEIIKSLKSKK